MSDREGELLFYSNGCKLWDANHEVIPGSDPLLPGEFHEEWCVGGSWKGMPRVRTMIGLPFELTEDSTLYYVYHVRDSFVEEPYFNAIAYIRVHAVLHTDSGLEVLYTDSAVTVWLYAVAPKKAIQFCFGTNLANKSRTFVSAQTRAIAYSYYWQ